MIQSVSRLATSVFTPFEKTPLLVNVAAIGIVAEPLLIYGLESCKKEQTTALIRLLFYTKLMPMASFQAVILSKESWIARSLFAIYTTFLSNYVWFFKANFERHEHEYRKLSDWYNPQRKSEIMPKHEKFQKLLWSTEYLSYSAVKLIYSVAMGRVLYHRFNQTKVGAAVGIAATVSLLACSFFSGFIYWKDYMDSDDFFYDKYHYRAPPPVEE